jgi:hypothetical protein
LLGPEKRCTCTELKSGADVSNQRGGHTPNVSNG